MAVYKNESNGTWYVMIWYTDWTGKRKQKCKRGFKREKDAKEWEMQFKLQKQADPNMTLESFYEMYEKDIKPTVKLNTWKTKDSYIRSKVLPYLGKRKLSEITAKDIVDWQNEVRKLPGSKKGTTLAAGTLKTIHGELSALFNHAVRYYGLHENPARVAGGMGEESEKEMEFWIQDEYKQFIEEVMDKPISYYAFELLYWCGIREGELLALTLKDFDFKRKTLRINKSYQRIDREDVITSPKTKQSNRVISVPDFLIDEMNDFKQQFYDLKATDRMFPISKKYLYNEMVRGCKASGVKKIRVHDLRHSHVSLLIDMGFTALAIGKRVGHTSEKITERYSHLFPNRQEEMADRLNLEKMKMNEEDA